MQRLRSDGFSLPEVLVALVILGVGLVGLASAGAAASRLAGRGRRDMQVAGLAAGRLELLRGAACRGASSGVEVVGPFTVAWALTAAAPGYRHAYVSVTRQAAIGGAVNAFEGVIPC